MTFHLHHFLSAPSRPELQEHLRALPHFPPDLQHCLVTGPQHSGKTSLLLHYAHSIATQGRQVVFICKKDKIERNPPSLVQGLDSRDAAFTLVHMRYLESASDLRRFAACLHLLRPPPAAVVVDDLSSFITVRADDKRAWERELMSTLAYLHDATNFVSRDNVGICSLVVTDPSGSDGMQHLYIYQRWLPLIFLITASGESNYSLTVRPAVGDRYEMDLQLSEVQLKYRLTIEGLLSLEALTCNVTQSHPGGLTFL